MATLRQAQGLAARLGIQAEVIYAYVNEHNGLLPPDIPSLQAWGRLPSHNYPQLGPRLWSDGSWHPQRPGANCDDYCLEPMFQWPDPAYGPDGGPLAGAPAPQPGAGGSAPPAPAPRSGGAIVVPGVGSIDSTALLIGGAVVVGALLLFSGRR